MLDNNGDLCQTIHLKRLINKSLPCVSTLYSSQVELNNDMIRKRHIYETAFDSTPQNTDKNHHEDIDDVSNHPVLVQLTNNKIVQQSNINLPGTSTDCDTQPHKVTLCQDGLVQSKSLDILSQNVQDIQLDSKEHVLRVYTPSPPSTVPLSKDFFTNNTVVNKTIDNITQHLPCNIQGQYNRIKDLRLPVKSLQLNRSPNSDPNLVVENLNDTKKDHEVVFETKDRTRKMFKRYKDGSKEIFFYTKGRRPKYSSSESMTTSSSGSMDSLQSSTSEGNRSTSSCESRQSTSLSSHSSDSGNTGSYAPVSTFNFLTHSNKLNVLSPISDKSSQEGISDEIDTRNNNSQKSSPEETPKPSISKPKRLPLDKNVFNLGFRKTELQGSDSGISIQSREGKVINASNQNIADLPFDIPKLRHRGIHDASGSTTSVDLKGLPFDMPKLKRRFHPPESSGSVGEIDKQIHIPPTLSLNFDAPRKKPGLSLTFGRPGLNLNIRNNTSSEEIDPNLPLERQGWYHGTITRVEAEILLKFLQEGSFLVRNSESQRHDHFLSLKSARGFMHIRIERLEGSGLYILADNRKPFGTIPEMIHHYSLNRLPVHGAEHMCLMHPVIAQLL